MPVLHLVRHGETDWNRDGRVQGSSDVALNETGRQQARDAGGRFAALAAPPGAVVSSDLVRASETADILAAALGLPAPRRVAGLRERAYGEAEGMHAVDVVARWGDWAVQQVPGAEAWEGVRARGIRALGEVVAGLGDPPPASVVVVSHGALIRQVVRHLSDDRLPAQGTRLRNLEGVSIEVVDDRMQLLGAWPEADS